MCLYTCRSRKPVVHSLLTALHVLRTSTSCQAWQQQIFPCQNILSALINTFTFFLVTYFVYSLTCI